MSCAAATCLATRLEVSTTGRLGMVAATAQTGADIIRGVVGRGQGLFDGGCGSDEDGEFSSDVMGILIVFGLPIKGANEVDISKSNSFIDLHDK